MTIRGPRRPHVVPITAPSFPTPPRSYVYRKIAYSFLALTVIVVLSVIWLSSVRAQIDIRVKREAVNLDGIVEVARAPQSGQIPGRVVQGVFESRIQEFQVKGTTTTDAGAPSIDGVTMAPASPTTSTADANAHVVPTQTVIARGSVRIINKYSRAQTLIKTTRLLTPDQKLYRLDKTIRVEPGQEVTVDVHADQVGDQFVIQPSRFTIPGLFVDLQTFIYAQSDASFVATPADGPTAATPKSHLLKPAKLPLASSTGLFPSTALAGSHKLVTAADITEAHRILTEALLEQAKQVLAAEVSDPHFTEVVIFFKAIDKKTNVSVGQAADTFLASVKLDVTAVYYPKEDMQALIRSRLKERIPEGREFLPLDDHAVTYTLESADAKAEVASIHVVAAGAYRLTSASQALQKSAIAGKTVAEAMDILRAVPGVDEVHIAIRPAWLGKIPALKDHIDINIQ